MKLEILNGNQALDTISPSLVQGHPVLIVATGSTMAELAPESHTQLQSVAGLVPRLFLCIDSLSYDDLTKRLEQAGWSSDTIEQAIPPSHYFHLANPFTADFDFEHPLNRNWKKILFDPSLQRIASRSESPGCNGTPAVGRARVESCLQELKEFFQRHIRNLTHMREETLGIRGGVLVFVVTTARGGSGIGASIVVAAVLKEVLYEGRIFLHVAMPDIYGGDRRAIANAYAMLMENQGYHQYGRQITTKDGRILLSPYDATTYYFGTNGRISIDHRDILKQEAAILSAYLRDRTQAAILAREIDLTDVVPYDHTDRPMHVRTEMALSVRVIQPGILDFLALQWLQEELEKYLGIFSDYMKSLMLSQPKDRERIDSFMKELRSDPATAVGASELLALLEASAPTANRLRSFFERVGATIGTLKTPAVKELMQQLVPQIQKVFGQFHDDWKEGSRRIAQEFPQKILERVRTAFEGEGHLILAALKSVHEALTTACTQLEREAQAAAQNRDRASSALYPAMKDLHEARSWLIGSDRVVRDAALKVLRFASAAANERHEQERREVLLEVLKGLPSAVACITEAIEALRTAELKRFRENIAKRMQDVNHRLGVTSKTLDKRSPVFQHSLLYDRMDADNLKAVVSELREKVPVPAASLDYLKGRLTLDQAVGELKPLLPAYTEASQTLADILESTPSRMELLCQLLKSATPFTPIDPVVEEHQRLKNRRDRSTILELPGGKASPLVPYLIKQNIVPDENCIVDSGDDEIRLFTMRIGLPYGALEPLAKLYVKEYEAHTAQAGSINPHTTEAYREFPSLDPPRVNVTAHIEQLLYRAKATLPSRLEEKPSGGFLFHYQEDSDHGFQRSKTGEFADFQSIVHWLSRNPGLYKAVERDLKTDLDSDPARHKQALFKSWRDAFSREKEVLEEALYALKVNPETFQVERKAGGKNPRGKSGRTARDLNLLKKTSTINPSFVDIERRKS